MQTLMKYHSFRSALLTLFFYLFIWAQSYAKQPSVKASIGDRFLPTNSPSLSINLTNYITADAATNLVRVTTSLTSSNGIPVGFTLQLLPSNAPLTVANFLAYVNDGAYENIMVHRLASNFVMQTGGFTLSGADPLPVATFPPITNEFKISNSNIRGTVAMAKLNGDPNSATSQWFVNLADNSSNLDHQNGGFTVFARVLAEGMTNVVDKINSIPAVNLTSYFSNQASTYPNLSNYYTAFDSVPVTNNALVGISRVATIPYFALSSDSTAYAPRISNSTLFIDYTGGTNPPTSPVTISLFATDTNGLTTNSSFQVWYRTNAVQTITFPSISNQPYSPGPFFLPTWPTSSDGIPITSLSFTGPLSIATNGNAYFTGVGTITFTAISAGNLFYKPATNAISFIVTPAPQTITFPQILPTNQIYSTNPFILTNPPYSSSGIPVNISIKQGSPLTVISNKFFMTGVGTVTLVASNATNVSYYNPAAPVTNLFTISQASQTITFPSITNQVLPVTPLLLKATSSVGLQIAYSLISNSPATLTNGNTLRINGPGAITIVANQAGTNVYLPATPVTNSFRAASNQTIGALPVIPNRTYTNPSANITITPIPKASSGLPVSFSVKSGPASLLYTNSNSVTFSITGAGTVILSADQSGNSNFFAASQITNSFVVAKAMQNFSSFTGLPAKLTNGIAPFTVTIPSTSSGLTPVLLRASGAGFESNNTITITNAGILTLTATNAGNSNYLAASVTTNFPVALGDQFITFTGSNPACQVGLTYTLQATASSGLPVSYSLLPANTTNASLTGTNLFIRSFTTNKISIVAKQTGNSGYNAATNVTNFFTIIPNQGGGSVAGSINANYGSLTLGNGATWTSNSLITINVNTTLLIGTNSYLFSNGTITQMANTNGGNSTLYQGHLLNYLGSTYTLDSNGGLVLNSGVSQLILSNTPSTNSTNNNSPPGGGPLPPGNIHFGP
jgi:cyclophilin family peptidyl-prolyl cis-trans isomerase